MPRWWDLDHFHFELMLASFWYQNLYHWYLFQSIWLSRFPRTNYPLLDHTLCRINIHLFRNHKKYISHYFHKLKEPCRRVFHWRTEDLLRLWRSALKTRSQPLLPSMCHLHFLWQECSPSLYPYAHSLVLFENSTHSENKEEMLSLLPKFIRFSQKAGRTSAFIPLVKKHSINFFFSCPYNIPADRCQIIPSKDRPAKFILSTQTWNR